MFWLLFLSCFSSFIVTKLRCLPFMIQMITHYHLIINIRLFINNYNRNYIRQMLDPQLGEIEFYHMKIGRLESDLIATQEELMSARLRLRTAEDYQIKYQLLLKQFEQESDRFKSYEVEEEEKIAELITLKIKQRDNFWSDKQNKLQRQITERYTKQINRITQQFAAFKKKHEKCGNKFDDQDLLAFKNKKLQKENEALEQKISEMKRQYERSREQEIKSMKQSISSKNKEKQDNQRKIYRQKIQQLERNISELQTSLIDARQKADPERQKEIEKLRDNLHIQIQKSNDQIYNLSQGFIQKNREIQSILQDKLKTQQGLISQKKQLREYIKALEDKLFQKQKQHEIQLIHLKERMSKIRDEESESLKAQINKIEQTFHQQRQSWKIIITDKDKQIERMKNKYEDDTQRHKDDKAKQLKKIEELKQRLKQFEGDREVGQTEQLLKSMKDIEAREEDFNNYENGVTFLDRQLKKAVSKIEQKNIEITKLLKQLNQVRKQSEIQINDLRQKNRKDRKYYIDKIGQLQEQIKILNEDIRTKQRESKKKQKDLQNKIAQLLKQNKSLKDLVQQMQRDYTRVVDSKKAIEMSYRQEREKGLTSKSDLTMVKKQKWLEMERQKNQIQAIFKQKQEQLKNKHEIEIEKLRHERDQLKSQNQILKGLAESVRRQAGDQNKENKQALYSQYHKKMATLNLQIALTKNIYDALVNAKSRKPKQSKVSEFQKIEEDASNSEQNQEIDSPFRDSKGPKFLTGSDIPKLTMSFNPSNR